MTEQQIFDACAYHMLAHGGSPRDILVKSESRTFTDGRHWGYLVKQKRAPRHASQLIHDLDELHKLSPLDALPAALSRIAQLYKLEPPQ